MDANGALAIINAVNADTYAGWFEPRDVLAVIAVESRFNPNAYNPEGDGRDPSRGLMQIRASTARDRGVADPETLFDPETNIRTGMAHLKWSWDFLSTRLGRDPTEAEWIGSYNAGVGNILNGYQNVRYVSAFQSARDGIAYV